MKTKILLLLTLFGPWAFADNLKFDRADTQYEHYSITADNNKGFTIQFYRDIEKDCNRVSLHVGLEPILKEESVETYIASYSMASTAMGCGDNQTTKTRIIDTLVIKTDTYPSPQQNYSVRLLVPQELKILRVTELK